MTTATLHDVLSVDLHFHPGACSVRLSGELDRLSCPQLAAGVDRALSACGVVVLVVVDLRHVSFCDLDGLRALEAARTRAERQGVRVRCEGSSPLLRRVASLLGFEELLTSSPGAGSTVGGPARAQGGRPHVDGRAGGTSVATPFPGPPLGDDEPVGAVELLRTEDALTVALTGEIDDELRPALDAVTADVDREVRAAARPVVVDATAVSFMDSAGAAFLARLAVAVRPARIAVRPSEPVEFLLNVTRLSEVVDVQNP